MEIFKNSTANTKAPIEDPEEKSISDPSPTLYQYSFFSEELRSSRKMLIQTLLMPLLYTSLLLWLCLSLYWGSTMSSSISELNVYVIDLDHTLLGQQVVAGVRASLSTSVNSLGWQFDDAISTDSMSRQLLLDEQAWAVVQVNPNVSSRLDTALRTGDSSYSAFSAVTIYLVSARNQITTSSKHTAMFLSANAGNITSIQTALRCTGCLVSPFGAQQIDLLPFDVPAAVGSTMVGLIFLLTFTFSIFQILHVNGELIGAKLNLRSTLMFRILIALLAYLFMALWYTLINVAFGVPMGRFFGRGGFLVYWMLNTCTMAALGLPMESLFTIIGLKWAGYFLSFWVIVNVAGSFVSFEVIPAFYKYGYGFPFFNSIQGARTIIFGTKSHLGLNFGILIAWMVIGLVGMIIFTSRMMKQSKRKSMHALK